MSERKSPRLVIRRDAERELTYHYKREERLQLGSAPAPAPAGGSFLKNRTFRLILLNAVLLAVIVFIGQWLLQGGGERARIGGYAVSLQALRFEESVYATVSVRRAGRTPPGEGRFAVLFVLEPGGERAEKSGALPLGMGEEVTVGEAIPAAGGTGAVRAVRAELTVEGRTQRLRCSLR